MSEENNAPAEETTEAPKNEGLKLNGLFAFKVGMSSIYSDKGANIPVTVLKYDPWVVSQLKTEDSDGYQAVQIACQPKRATRTSGAEKGHLGKAGFENGARYIREIRQALPEGIEVGQKVELGSLEKGDKVKLTAKSKGRGFAGVMKRHNFGGGRASHGSGFHRRPGSIGMCEFPGRVLPGKKMPGHFGQETTTVRNVEIIDVIPEENVLLVKGNVPGARNSIVRLMKENA